MRRWMWMTALLAACGPRAQQVSEEAPAEAQGEDPNLVILKYEQKTQELVDTTNKLTETRGKLDEQQRRLAIICNDYPDHAVCQPQTQAAYARALFCEDKEFTTHVDEVVAACNQGTCKQLDEAAMITRQQYMLLTQRLPHSLITFGASSTRLDGDDKRQLQQFVENMGAEKGYVIIVGRASKDGSWKRNVQLAIDRAEHTRQELVKSMGLDPARVGYITYGHDKMYLTALDAERLSQKKLSPKQANRSALIFAYPCFEGKATPVVPELMLDPIPVEGGGRAR
ncbi:MAG: OmpA family protein [Myxococcales bacterium]|nr:OmpA family protein [Myxococcales bacterium]MCB9549256.1 OmpA family protein [Myxococcales bacterium]